MEEDSFALIEWRVNNNETLSMENARTLTKEYNKMWQGFRRVLDENKRLRDAAYGLVTSPIVCGMSAGIRDNAKARGSEDPFQLALLLLGITDEEIHSLVFPKVYPKQGAIT